VYPEGAVRELLRIETRRGSPVASIPEWGGYLTLFGKGVLLPVIDDRNTLLGETFYKYYLKQLSPEGDWKELLHRFHARYLLLPSSAPMASEIRRRLALPVVYDDGVAAVFRAE
jgi:hypothetical protein